MAQRSHVVFYVNQKRHQLSGNEVFQTFAEFVRYQMGLTGTKIVCAEGDCGACTVLVGSIHEAQNGSSEKLIYKAVNSCIIPLYLLDCHHIITVEGIQNESKLHPVQEAMIEHQGAQCGYCTPGFICALAACTEDVILNHEDKITEKKAANFLTGNLCRCTGYKPILDAATHINLKQIVSFQDRYHNPERNEELRQLSRVPAKLCIGENTVYLPTSLKSALEIKQNNPEARLIAGSTDIGVLVNKGKTTTPSVLSLQHLSELYQIKEDSREIWIGARVTLNQFENYIEDKIPEKARMMRIFASPQIKNQGTLIGNVVNGSPIGDTLPYLMVAPATLQIANREAHRELPITEFYLGYKKLNLKSDELVTGIKIPQPHKNDKNNKSEKLKLYKVSLRKDLDISAVTFAGAIGFDMKTVGQVDTISTVRLSFGGVGPIVLRMSEMEEELLGKPFIRSLFESLGDRISQFIKPQSDLRASREYRLLLCRNLLLKFYDEVASEVSPLPVRSSEVTA